MIDRIKLKDYYLKLYKSFHLDHRDIENHKMNNYLDQDFLYRYRTFCY